jgi:glyoxylase-like metal-dependent hydrolase (beta-lactamase superfamily II)
MTTPIGAIPSDNPRPRTLTRRHVLRGTAVLAGTALAAPVVRRPIVAGAEPSDRTTATGRLLTFESDGNGFNTKTFFYDTGAEVVAFDTQFTPGYAAQAIAYLRTQTANPLTFAVITHPNPDKFNGLTAFQEAGARIVAARSTVDAMPEVQAYKQAFFVGAGMFTEDTYPPLGAVDVVFEGGATLDLGGGQTVELRELSGPGVSSTQTVALLPELDALVVGDLVHHRAHAWLEGGIVDGKPTPTIDGWIADLTELQERFGNDSEDTVVYGGRGEAVPLAASVEVQITYLKRADQIVADYVAGLGARRAELSGPEAGDHYAALQKEFDAAFPDYALGYMILYGVYGLVNAKL